MYSVRSLVITQGLIEENQWSHLATAIRKCDLPPGIHWQTLSSITSMRR